MTTPKDSTPRAVRLESAARLPTRHGDFRVYVFTDSEGREHAALARGDLFGQERVPVRLHSECLTGDAFGSLRCDCREQLDGALQRLGAMPRGVVVYLRQEGRGIGLANKIRAYALQERGLDTLEANLALGFREDERTYDAAAAMLRALGVRSVLLMTNNPDKMRGLERHGVAVAGRIPLLVKPGEHNRAYLETKRRRAGHLLDPLDEAAEA